MAARKRLGDPVLSSTVSFAVPFVAFFPAEEIRASGVLAVVVAGLVTGKVGAHRLPATERTTTATNWATVSFVLENAVFLVMGMQITALIESARADGSFSWVVWVSLLVFGLLIVLRAGGILSALLRFRKKGPHREQRRALLDQHEARLAEFEDADRIDSERAAWLRRRLDRNRADLDFAENEAIGRTGGVVLAWAGMRGVVTLAAAETIPVAANGQPTPFRETVVLIAFIVAVASLVLFGGTLPAVIRKLDLPVRTFADRSAEVGALVDDLTGAVADRLGPIGEQQVDGKQVPPEVADLVADRIGPMLLSRNFEVLAQQPDAREIGVVLQRRYATAYREALAEEQAIGAYSTEALEFIATALDRDELRLPRG